MQCAWAYDASQEMQAYHAKEWGKPQYDEQKLFEILALEIFQAGLSWQTILHKRTALRQAFCNFEIEKVAQLTPTDVAYMLTNPQIIRNRRKIQAVITNAKLLVKLHAKKHSLSDLIWSYVAYRPIVNQWQHPDEIPSQTPLAKQIAHDLKKLGFTFIGPTIVYSFLQASGVVNDHLMGCPYK